MTWFLFWYDFGSRPVKDWDFRLAATSSMSRYPEWLCSLWFFVHVRLLDARLFIFCCCWRRSGTTSGAMHTAMPRTIVPLSMYIITASSYRYKDGCTHFSLPSGILRQLDVWSTTGPCLYYIYTTLYCQGINRRRDVSISCFNIRDIPSRSL